MISFFGNTKLNHGSLFIYDYESHSRNCLAAIARKASVENIMEAAPLLHLKFILERLISTSFGANKKKYQYINTYKSVSQQQI